MSYQLKREFYGSKNHPLAGLILTLDDYISWSQRLFHNDFLNEESLNQMWSKFDFTVTDRRFLHGWDVYEVNEYDSYGFSGGGVSGFRYFPDQDLTIIVLTTGYKNYSIQDIMIEGIAGILSDELDNSTSIITESIMQDHILHSDEPIPSIMYDIKSVYPERNLEEIIKSIGYTLFFDLNKKELAISLFEENVKEYPGSYDTFGSLGYLQFLTEDYKNARVNYAKALELNPKNTYSVRRMKEIDGILANEN